MNILVLIHEFPPVGGGGGRVAQDLCHGLAARGHNLRVLTARMDGLPDHEEVDGFHVIRIGPKRRFAFRALLHEMLGYNLAAIWHGLRLTDGWKPDVIHTHFAVPAGAAAFWLSKLTGVPYILTAHLGDVPGGVPEKTDHIFRWVFPLTPSIWQAAARVVAVSHFTRRIALESYPNVQVDVIHNGVDRSVMPERELDATRPPRIIFAGRFVEQKNPTHLVQALAGLKDLPWNCVMLGDGPLQAEVKEQIAAFGLQDRFTLPGWVTPEEVLDWCRRGDILCLPSRSEGLPVAGVQALAMGLAVVLSNVGGNTELVRHGENGFLFEPGDVPALQTHLKTLLASSKTLKSAQAYSFELANQFNLQTIVGQYEGLFKTVTFMD